MVLNAFQQLSLNRFKRRVLLEKEPDAFGLALFPQFNCPDILHHP